MGIVQKQSLKNSIYFYIGLMFGALSTVILYPNAFNSHPEHLGLLQIIIAYSIVVSTFSSLGTPKTLIRFFPKVENKNQLISLSFMIPIIGFLLVLLLYFLFKDDLLNFVNADELLRNNFHLVFFLVSFLSFFEVLSSLSRSLLNATIPIFLREVFLKGFNILLLILHWFDYIYFTTFLYSHISLYLFMILILFLSIFKKYKFRFTFRLYDIEGKQMISYGLFVLAGGASAILVSKVDMMMIGKLMNLESVAYYTIAFFIGNVILVPSRAIGSITAPLIAKAWKEKNISEIKEIYEKSSLNQLLLGGFIFLIIWLNIDEGLALLPEKFQGGKYVVLYIALSKLFSVATGVNGQIIINSKYYRFDLYSNFILLIITIFTNYIFIPESSPLSEYNIVGINGAAFATALSVIIFNSLKMMYVYFKVGIQPFSFRTIKSILLIIFVYFSLMFLNLTFLDIPNMIVKSLLISIIYFSIMFVLRISEDLNSMIKDLWNNLVS